MIFGLFQGRANRKLIERLHGKIVAAARNPHLFTNYGVEDTFEGRFESLVLHAALVLRRLQQLPSPGPEIAQDLVDILFRQFDIALRQIGVADTAVPKRMKAMAQAYCGRVKTYQDALAKEPSEGMLALSRALSRNVYAGRRDGTELAHYVRRLDAALAQATLPVFLAGSIPFVRPASASDRTQ